MVPVRHDRECHLPDRAAAAPAKGAALTGGGAPPTTLLLVIQAPFHRSGDHLLLDRQACNGLRLWLDHFDRVLLCAPLADGLAEGPELADPRMEAADDRLELHPLPLGWTPLAFLRALPSVRRSFAGLIGRATHLHFAIGGSWGDWGALGAVMAARRGRRAAVWTDRVESAVMRAAARRHHGPRRLYRLFNAWLAERLERLVIRRSAMGLFHGEDTYRAYAGFSPDPQLVHDVHLGPEYRIDPAVLAAKAVRRSGPLRILYAGRVHPDKGPDDWITALAALSGRVDFIATWHGDGPWLRQARDHVRREGLYDSIGFPGACTDREALMASMRDADLFLFCHKTPESPRCLVEALLSGTPIVGYDSAYPAGLIAGHGGGVLTPPDPAVLGDALSALAEDRDRLGALAVAAAADGHPLVDSAVFAHRAGLIKRL